MATLTVQEMDVTNGLSATYAAASGGGDDFANDGDVFLHVKNGGAGSVTVNINSVPANASVQGIGTIPVPDPAIAVANGTEKLIGPFPPSRFNNSTGKVSVSYSGVTSVTVAAIGMAVVR